MDIFVGSASGDIGFHSSSSEDSSPGSAAAVSFPSPLDTLSQFPPLIKKSSPLLVFSQLMFADGEPAFSSSSEVDFSLTSPG